jgi:hypothetical protein
MFHGCPRITDQKVLESRTLMEPGPSMRRVAWIKAMPVGMGRRSPEATEWPIPLAPAIQHSTIDQNVAGMWLKYGVDPRGVGAILSRKIVFASCDNLLTMGVDKSPRVGL